MGCHTWFLKKINLEELTNKEMEKEINKNINETIEYINKQIEENKENKKEIEEWKEEKEFYIKYRERIKEFKDNDFKKSYLTAKGIEYTEVNNSFYEGTEYHDIFRHGNYEAKELYSLEETIEFIKENKCKGNGFMNKEGKLEFEEVNIEKIKEFWEKYPDGIIEFG